MTAIACNLANIAFVCARVLNVMFRLEMIISNKQLTKALIKLHECTDWSAPLLFAQSDDRFLRVDAIVQILLLGFVRKLLS